VQELEKAWAEHVWLSTLATLADCAFTAKTYGVHEIDEHACIIRERFVCSLEDILMGRRDAFPLLKPGGQMQASSTIPSLSLALHHQQHGITSRLQLSASL